MKASLQRFCLQYHTKIWITHPRDERPLLLLLRDGTVWKLYDANGIYLDRLRTQQTLQVDEENIQLILRPLSLPPSFYLYQAVGEIWVGRGKENTLALPEPFISVRHTHVWVEAGKVFLEDLNSTNGTFVNGKRCERCVLQPGDVVEWIAAKLVIGGGFFASSQPLSLPAFSLSSYCLPPLERYRQVLWLKPLQTSVRLSLEPLLPLSDTFGNSWLLQMGPGLTMALFSFLAMQSMAAVNYWMIAGMISSTVFWPLCSLWRQRRTKKKEQAVQRKTYRLYLQKRKAAALQAMRQREQQAAAWAKALLQESVWLRGSPTFLYPGKGDMGAAVEWEDQKGTVSYSDVPLCKERARLLAMDTTAKQAPLILPVSKLIWVEDEDLDMIWSLSAQLMKQQEAGYRVALYGFRDLRSFGRLRFLPCFHDENGNRLWLKDEQQLKEVLQRYPHLIVIAAETCWRNFAFSIWEQAFFLIRSQGKAPADARALLIRPKQGRYIQNGKEQAFSPISYPAKKWDTFCRWQMEKPIPAHGGGTDFLALYECGHVEQLVCGQRWQQHAAVSHLNVAIGWDREGKKIYLDAHEGADGPHGIIAGTTGSGKSELLLTYLLSLACCFPPDRVSFFLIDYKGGAMARALDGLPHVCGEMSNLDDASMQRVRISLRRELRLRQEQFQRLMRQHQLSQVTMELYRRYADASYPPLAHLFLVVDEFAQLKQEYAAFLEELRQIARIGRSLGIHLLLCTQKPGGTIDEQIWSNSRFHLCLKVQSAEDSRDMLHSDAALQLRNAGEMILQVGNNERFARGQSAYANADYAPQPHYQPNRTHQLRMFNEEGQPLYRYRWQDRQAEEKQLHALCRYLQQTAEQKQVSARAICAEEPAVYAKQHAMERYDQIGWLDCPQQQQIKPFFIRHESYLLLSETAAYRQQFLRVCSTALARERVWLIAGEKMDVAPFLSIDAEWELRFLLALLREQTEEQYVLIEDMNAFYQREPSVAEQLLALCRERRTCHLIACLEHIDYALLARLPFGMRRAAMGVQRLDIAREYFNSAADLPVSKEEGSGMVQKEQVYRFCLGKAHPNACPDRGWSVAQRARWKCLIGCRLDTQELYFGWEQGRTLLLYVGRRSEQKALKLRGEWQKRWLKDSLTALLCVKEAGHEETLAFYEANRYELRVLWLGYGIEEYGYRYGFHTASLPARHLAVREAGEEFVVRLKEEG